MATVMCPDCGVPVRWSDANRYRPFCSERCKLNDLGAWASDRYAVPGSHSDTSEEHPAESAPTPDQ